MLKWADKWAIPENCKPGEKFSKSSIRKKRQILFYISWQARKRRLLEPPSNCASIFPAARRFAEAGIGTGAAKRNWASYGEEVVLPAGLPEWRRNLLCDPQTSGGLLIACAADAVSGVLDLLRRRGFAQACPIGVFAAGPVRISVSP